MDLSSLATTTLGAAIGVGATLIADRTRWKRDHRSKEQDTKRQVYAEYLTALSRTRNELRLASRNPQVPAEERARMATEAFKAGGAYELRYQVAITAPPAVVEASTQAFRALRDLRDLVEAGITHREPSYLSSKEAWDLLFSELCRQIREDLAAG
ncbi:hypothetical protein DN069_21465 [Streptacidiphilus pinicola]|uniref:Uncharacterized protein n=1 Tax=Streptacidiphilus pinicola TaxID=2219663 RepID=A0A2X0J047_9ACTN|nr:hypothetical protein DN069_21465 [Streptacidiphilus pinicola]